MSKSRKKVAPENSGGNTVAEQGAPEVKLEQPTVSQSEASPEVDLCEIVAPLGPPGGGRFPFHVNLQIQPNQSEALQRLASGLDREKATLADGTRVTERRHAVRWLIDQLVK